MERKGLTLEALFRAKYNLCQETDVFALIQEAIVVASSEKPEEFMMRRSNLAEALFKKPREPCWVESDDEDMGCDEDNAGGVPSRKSNQITTIDALTGKDHACNTIEKHCDRSDNDGIKKGRRIIIKLPKMRKGVTSDVNKKVDQYMGCDGHANGVASRKSNLTVLTDAVTSKDRACAIVKNCARLDDNGDKWGRRIINFPKGHKEVITSEVSKKLDQDLGCNGHGDGKSSRKRPLSTITDAFTGKGRACAIEKHCPRSDDNGNKRGRRLIKFSENHQEVITEVKKKLDKDMAQTEKLESSVRRMESRYQQIRENRRKIQVLDLKDLPPPKSRCNNIPHRRPYPSFSKQQSFRRPLWG